MRGGYPGALFFLVLGAMGAGSAAWADPPTISVPGVDPATFVRLSDMIAGGIRGIGVAPTSCSADEAVRPGSACASYYDRMFEDGEFTMGVGIGYLEPAVDGNSPGLRFATIVNQLTRPCTERVRFSCGFNRTDLNLTGVNGTDFTALTKTFTYRGSDGQTKSVTARINLCNPFSPSRVESLRRNQSATCSLQFAQSMKYDDVTAYIGHSRYGSGPDFHPPVTTGDPPHVDAAHYRERHDGVDRFFSAEALRPNPASGRLRPPYKAVFMMGCSSDEHFSEDFRAAGRAAGYDDSSLDFAGTDRPTDVDGTETLRLIESMGRGQCARQIARSVQDSDDSRFEQEITDPGTGEVSLQIVSRPPRLSTTQLFNSRH